MTARAWLVLKPHNREWTQARRADDTWREAEPNLLSSAPPPGRLVAVVADLRLIPVVPDDADASQDFCSALPLRRRIAMLRPLGSRGVTTAHRG
jgi:hypothetical protein